MCTDFVIAAANGGGVVNGRSLEWGSPMHSEVKAVEAGTTFRADSPSGLGTGLEWTSTYPYLGMTVGAVKPLVIDGLNTQGLSCGALWFPAGTYPSTVTDDSVALDAPLVVDWVLGNHSTVDEVQAALSSPTTVQLWGDQEEQEYVTLHWAVHDAEGHSLVIELVDGELQLYADTPGAPAPNAIGVLTNDPPFPDQLTNLGFYSHLSPWDAAAVEIGGQPVAPAGHGSGMMGVPGDSTPPSRFVRAAYLRQFATASEQTQPSTAPGACNLAFHLLNDVDIAAGTSLSKSNGGQTDADQTQWAVVKDLTDQILYVRPYGDMCVFSVDLGGLDWQTASKSNLPLPTAPQSIDLTGWPS